MNTWTIYGILDLVASELVGGHGCLHTFRHAAQAVRMFDEIASNPNSPLAKRPEDYALVSVGDLITSEIGSPPIFHAKVIGEYEIILTGSAWAATKQGEPQLVKES